MSLVHCTITYPTPSRTVEYECDSEDAMDYVRADITRVEHEVVEQTYQHTLTMEHSIDATDAFILKILWEDTRELYCT